MGLTIQVYCKRSEIIACWFEFAESQLVHSVFISINLDIHIIHISKVRVVSFSFNKVEDVIGRVGFSTNSTASTCSGVEKMSFLTIC